MLGPSTQLLLGWPDARIPPQPEMHPAGRWRVSVDIFLALGQLSCLFLKHPITLDFFVPNSLKVKKRWWLYLFSPSENWRQQAWLCEGLNTVLQQEAHGICASNTTDEFCQNLITACLILCCSRQENLPIQTYPTTSPNTKQSQKRCAIAQDNSKHKQWTR